MRLVPALLIGLLFAASTSASSGWETNFDKAAAEAKASNRYMLLDFTGSDWCGWCVKLDKEVFSKTAFKKYAKAQLVLIELDFPRGKTISKKYQAQNEALMQTYGVRGFPTIILLSPSGELVGRTGYKDGGADAYVAHIKSFIDPHRTANNTPEPGNASPAKAVASKPTSSIFGLPYDANRNERTWTSVSGNTLDATLLQEQGRHLVLKKTDGSKAIIPLDQLSPADQAYVSELKSVQ